MKKALLILAVICAAVSFVLVFCLTGYTFTGFLFFLLALFFAFLSFCHKTEKHLLIILRRIVCSLAAVGIIFTCIMTGIVIADMSGDESAPCDCIIVLGAGLDGDTPSLTLIDRLRRTEEFLKAYPESIAIVSGGMGAGETVTEAFAMERWLIAHGIEKNRIIKEEMATDTNENLLFSKAIADERGFESFAIVSSDYHIFRARLLAKKQDIPAIMIPAKTTLPILRINYAVREGFALVKAKILKNI